jgi:hypothetical protein
MLFIAQSFLSYLAALQLALIILFFNLQVASSQQATCNHGNCDQYDTKLRGAVIEALTRANYGYNGVFNLPNGKLHSHKGRTLELSQ